jgi:hypothetical protein
MHNTAYVDKRYLLSELTGRIIAAAMEVHLDYWLNLASI